MTVYDLIIVGAGPAGITASIYAARKRMNFLVISRDLGGQTAWSGDIENYTGYQFIAGPELVRKFREHQKSLNVELKEAEGVTLLKRETDLITVETDKGKYQSRTAIVASGRVPRRLGVEGEHAFRNRGVTYCVTCDGPLFADRDVAVIGGGNAGLEAVLQLMKIANKIYLIEVAPELRADPIMVQKAEQSDKVTIYTETKVAGIFGDKFVTGMKIARGGTQETLSVEGIFIEIGSVPASGFVQGVAKNEIGEILVNCQCETSVPGIFASGDVTDVYGKQIIIACGEGAKAAMAAFEYVSKMK
jgi:alkyl hydroperoxide reductase subunit F